MTNASRTLLMNIHTCQWDDSLLEVPAPPAPYCTTVHVNSEHAAAEPGCWLAEQCGLFVEWLLAVALICFLLSNPRHQRLVSQDLGVPKSVLPEIRSSSEVYGTGVGERGQDPA